MRMIGPPVETIQALYMENPEGIAEYIAAQKKRDDYSGHAASGLPEPGRASGRSQVHAWRG